MVSFTRDYTQYLLTCEFAPFNASRAHVVDQLFYDMLLQNLHGHWEAYDDQSIDKMISSRENSRTEHSRINTIYFSTSLFF